MVCDFLRQYKLPEKTFRKEASDGDRSIKLHWGESEKCFVLDVLFFSEKKTTFNLSRDRRSSEAIFDQANKDYIEGDVYSPDYLRPIIEHATNADGFSDYTADEEILVDLIGDDRLPISALENPGPLFVKAGILTERELREINAGGEGVPGTGENESRQVGAPPKRNDEKTAKDVARARKNAAMFARTNVPEPSAAAISAYVDAHLPAHLREPSPFVRVVSRALDLAMRAKEFFGTYAVVGRENIPKDGAFLAISNHSGGETGKLLALFGDRPFHIAAGKELNFNRSSMREWLLKKLQMIPVKETLSHLSPEEKEELMRRVPERSRPGYERIIQNEEAGSVPSNKEFVQTTVAALINGDRAVVFPEGLFTYGDRGLRKAYPGFLLIASEYKRQTGKDLRLLPVGCSKSQTSVGEPFVLGESTGIDEAMGRIAALLPSEERGQYRE